MNKIIQKPNQDSKPDLSGIAVCGKVNYHKNLGTYRIVWIATKKLIYESPHIPGASDYVLEYFGLSHAFWYCLKHNLSAPIYSSNDTVVKWVVKGKDFTKHPHQELIEKILKAQNWFLQNPSNIKISLWDRKSWGKNPADIRKLLKYKALY